MKTTLKTLGMLAVVTLYNLALAQPIDQATMRERQASMPHTSGTGPYGAFIQTIPEMPDHVIYRPQNLDAMGDTKLGLYIFGNGGCSDDAASSRLHLLEVASHGYLAIAPGRFYSGPGSVARTVPAPGINAAPTRPEQLKEALDWALAENMRQDSPYYNRIDPEAVALSGYSCGGIQALLNAGDARVATVVVMNSGLMAEGRTTMGGMDTGKEILRNLHTPTIYVQGGPSDIAYANGMDDYAQIEHVPIAMANIDVGHGGTYWDPNGGQAAQVVVNWLNWQLRQDVNASRMFLGEACGLCRDSQWTFEKKGLD